MGIKFHYARRPEWLVPVTVVCGVLGALIMLRFQGQGQISQMARYRRPEILSQMLASAQKELEDQKKEIGQLRDQVTEYQTAAADATEMMNLLNQQLQDYKVLVGVTEVKGPGVELTLDDSKARVAPGQEANPLLIHDYDLLLITNELRAAGAEAISLNGHRIVSNTAVRCSGPTILVNDIRIAGPFTFLAIGDAKVLSGALDMPMGILDQLKAIKIQVKLAAKEEIIIPAVAMTPKVEYAQPVSKEEKEEKEGQQ